MTKDNGHLPGLMNLKTTINQPESTNNLAVKRCLTVRRMRSGALELFVGDEMIAGVGPVAIVDDGVQTVMTVQFDITFVAFDHEKADTANMN